MTMRASQWPATHPRYCQREDGRGKRAYRTRRWAERVAHGIGRRADEPPMQPYRCVGCGHWHLSDAERGEE